MKYLFLIFSCALVYFACQNDTPNTGNAANDEASNEAGDTEAGLDHLKKNALPENDYYARVEHSLVTLQEEYRKAEGKVPGIGKVTVFVDSSFTLLLKNEIGGDIYETKVSMKNLNPNNGGMELIPDLTEGEYPGVKLNVLSGRSGVEIRKNGKFESLEDALVIYLPDRPSVERVTPALAQALNIVHKKLK